jgi:hypothetical protein
MASPFRTFRKNQKAWMVTLTILTMFAFVFLGRTQMGGSGGKLEDPEVFTWDYGTVHKSDLQNRKNSRQLVKQFLTQAILSSNPDPMVQQHLPEILERLFPNSEEKFVEAMLLEKKAQQLGIVISDEMVNQAIRNFTQDRLRPETLAAIVRQMQGRTNQISQADLFDALRSELAARYAEEAFSPLFIRTNGRSFMFRGDTPGDRWDYFCRLNRKVTAEIMALPVESFVGEIPDPSAAELQKFYDQYKNVEPQAASPTPGFRQPFKAKFQYVKADYDKMLAAESPKITDQQIKDYYDEHKDEFKKTNLPDLPSTGESESKTETGAGPAKSETDMKSDETKSSASKAADKKSSEKSSDVKSSDSKAASKPSAAKPDAKKSDDKKSSDKKSADGKQSSDSPPPLPLGEGRGEGAATHPNDSLDGELLALADQPPAPPAQKSAVPASKAEAKSADVKADNSSPPKISDAKTPDTKTSDANAKTPDAKASDAQTSAPVEYEPLSKVTKVIRDRLAQQKVDEQVDAAFSAVELQLDQYTRSLDNYRAAVSRGNKSAKKPEAPDLAALTKPYGLEAKETDTISQQQAVSSTDIGKSYTLSVLDSSVAALTGQRYNAQPFARTAFALDASSQPTLAMYQPQRTVDNDNSRYLWWKTSDEAAHTPPLDEIKAQVTLAWKIIQARKPALAKADEDAAQARKLKQTLKETFRNIPGTPVSTIGPFSWLTQPIAQASGEPRLTALSGVQQAGNDFMKAVFALSPSEIGVASNEPQTVYYVVQVESEEPPLDDLRQEFMTKMGSDIAWIPYAAIGAEENAGLAPAWLKQVKNEYGFQLAPGQTLSDVRSNVE